MYVNFFTTQDKLDTLLRDGIPIRNKWTNVARKPNVIWLTENPNPCAPSPTDREFIAKLQPNADRWPPNYINPTPEFAFEGAVRVKFRIRLEQAAQWLWRAVDDFGTMRGNADAIYKFDDGWFVMDQTITPNQVTRVDEWSVQNNEWHRVKLNRRLERPAAIQVASPHSGYHPQAA